MTFIQPSKNSDFLNRIWVILILALVSGSVWLIVLYNNFVNLSQSAVQMKADISALQAQNAELKDKVFSLFDTQNLQNLAVQRHLIQDKNPEYLEINSPWSFASRY